MISLTPQMGVFYEKKYPGITFELVGSGLVATWHGERFALDNLTSIDEGLLAHFDALTPAPPATYIHAHSEEAYDEYRTADGFHRITVVYQNGTFVELHVRAYDSKPGDDGKPMATGQYTDTNYVDIDEINQLISTLHAAIAGINKKGKSNGPQQ